MEWKTNNDHVVCRLSFLKPIRLTPTFPEREKGLIVHCKQNLYSNVTLGTFHSELELLNIQHRAEQYIPNYSKLSANIFHLLFKSSIRVLFQSVIPDNSQNKTSGRWKISICSSILLAFPRDEQKLMASSCFIRQRNFILPSPEKVYLDKGI